MKREDYLKDKEVRAFLDWAKSLVTGELRLDHRWTDGHGHSEEFGTLLDGYHSYEWGGMSYTKTVEHLGKLSRRMRDAGVENEPRAFHTAAVEVLKWGRASPDNVQRLESLGEEALPLLRLNARLLDPAKADLFRVWAVHPMNSGFSKIYSLMLESFPIYDSRVACALGSLVRWFCHEEGHPAVPKLLDFGMPPNRGGQKKKDRAVPGFAKIGYGGTSVHAESNVMAAWVLGELSKHGEFGKLRDQRQFALQSAMFMVGYEPLATPKLTASSR